MFSNETKQIVCDAQNEYCKGCLKRIHSIHHKLHDTEYNRKKYPLFIDSPMNGVGLCHDCHKNNSHLYKITDKEADAYEEWLRKLLFTYREWKDES
jgi:hypothetical protein